MKKLDIAFGIYNINGYYIHALAALNSIFKRAPNQVTAHIIHDETLSGLERSHFERIAEHYRKEAAFHNIEKDVAKIPSLESVKRFSRGTLYRLFLPRILPQETVVYLDSDVIAAADIGDLFNNINNKKPLLAVLDTAPSHREIFRKYIKTVFNDYSGYFNAGALVFNNSLINEEIEDLPRLVINMLRERPELRFPEQDALNIIFGVTNNVGYLSGKANFQLENAKRLNYNEESLKGKLIHYSWHKPWQTAFPAGLPYWRSREEVNLILKG